MMSTLLAAAAIYLASGCLFTLFFHGSGLKKVDPGVKGAGLFFRVLITPGLIALWPVMALKWRRAARGWVVVGDAEAPVSPCALRSFHRRLVMFLALALPLAVAAGLLGREEIPTVEDAPMAPLPPSLTAARSSAIEGFVGLPITLSLSRSRGTAEAGLRRQVELKVEEDLEIPSLALFWSPRSEGEELSREAVYLGSVWGPTTLRFGLPPEEGGSLVLYSLAHQERLSAIDL